MSTDITVREREKGDKERQRQREKERQTDRQTEILVGVEEGCTQQEKERKASTLWLLTT